MLKFNNSVITPKNGYYRLGIRSHGKGTFHKYVKSGDELETAKMSKVEKDNFIVNITFAWEHAVAITSEEDEGKLVSHRFPQFSFRKDMVPNFFKFSILDYKFKHHLWLSSPGGAGRNRVLKLNQMLQYKFKVPNSEEQEKISQTLIKLDNLITLHQRKYNMAKKGKDYND